MKDSLHKILTSRFPGIPVAVISAVLTLLVALAVGFGPAESGNLPTEKTANLQILNGSASSDPDGLCILVIGGDSPTGLVAEFCEMPPIPVPSLTPTMSPGATVSITQTPLPTIAPEPTATATPHVHPTIAPVPTEEPLPGQLCPAWVHEQYTTLGPDGRTYPTWHPQTDPVYGCYFGHDHGVDPATSTANSTLPAFGYINHTSIIGGHDHPIEPHAGFKVFVWECGEAGDQGQNRIAGRLVVHMGTSGLARYTVPHHSAHYSAAACDGSWSMDIQGMIDFDGVGSICGPRAGRDFATLGCVVEDQPQTAYEIWTGSLAVNYPGEFSGLGQSRAFVLLSPAVFDPVTARNPADDSEYIYTVDLVYPGQYDPGSNQSPFRGCKMEAYHGPVSLNNRGPRPTQYVTDVYGNVLLDTPEGTPGTLTQFISNHRVTGTQGNASANGSQFKLVFDLCSPAIRPPN